MFWLFHVPAGHIVHTISRGSAVILSVIVVRVASGLSFQCISFGVCVVLPAHATRPVSTSYATGHEPSAMILE